MSDTPAWLWADKAVLRRIRERIPDVTSALGVYCALCEIASDNQAEEFTATQQAIAMKSGLSVRTVGDRLRDLVSAGAISENAPKIKGPSLFTLLSSSGNGCRSIRNGCRSIGNAEPDPLQIPNIREESRGGENRPLSKISIIAGEKELAKIENIIRELENDRTSWNTPDWTAKKQKAKNRRLALLKTLGRLA